MNVSVKKAVSELRSQPWGIVLFALHRSRWLRGQIIEHSINVIHLIYYSIHHLLQH